MFGKHGHRLYFLNAGHGSQRWLWIIRSLTIMVRRRRKAADPALELVLEPMWDPAEVAGDLTKAMDLAQDRVLELVLDPVEVADDLPAEIVAGDLPVEVVTASRYHLPALSSSNWNGFFISSADDVEELPLKNGGKPIKICYLSSLDEDQKESILLYCEASNVEHEQIGDPKMEEGHESTGSNSNWHLTYFSFV
ncbi:hypothetical protein FH972_000843 [Carpinus fangiana]|uniref:Uncharacterized protein n=1 Tax=Carpinus fangiana TaxID=176857 RepID=A0A5N6QA95_9ROSI|nr:hypothetical protein FH972_000843 [Carpinus fangiana]